MSTTTRKSRVKLTATNKVAVSISQRETENLKVFLEQAQGIMEENMPRGILNTEKAKSMVFIDAINSVYRKHFTKLSLPEQKNKMTLSIGQSACIWIFFNRISQHHESDLIESLRGLMEDIHQKLS